MEVPLEVTGYDIIASYFLIGRHNVTNTDKRLRADGRASPRAQKVHAGTLPAEPILLQGDSRGPVHTTRHHSRVKP